MDPYKPPEKNPSEDSGKSWIAQNWWVLLATGAFTAVGSIFVTHYLGGWLRKREERARLAGEIAEAEALGEQAVEVNPDPEPDVFERIDGLESQLSEMARHFGLK